MLAWFFEQDAFWSFARSGQHDILFDAAVVATIPSLVFGLVYGVTAIRLSDSSHRRVWALTITLIIPAFHFRMMAKALSYSIPVYDDFRMLNNFKPDLISIRPCVVASHL